MKMRCRECKTIYDNSEKYCPFCFARTNPIRRATIKIDGQRQEEYKPIPLATKLSDNQRIQPRPKQDNFVGFKDKQTPVTAQNARQKVTNSTNNRTFIKDSYASLKDKPTVKVKPITKQKAAEDIGTFITIIIIIMVILSLLF